MEKYDLLFESVFKKDPASADTASFLEKITEAYPYFSVAQFYQLQSLKKDTPEYKTQLKKTAALFNNNYWLHFQLLEAAKPHATIVDQQKFSLEENETVADESEITAVENHAAVEIAEEPALIESIESTPTLQEETIPETEQPPVTQEEETTKDEPAPVELISENENTEAPVFESSATIEIEKEIIPPATEQEIEMPPIKLSIEMPAANIVDDAILFEPLHTTDYFASVGIKLSEEVKSEDKLGKQLKSFTEWLKTMKKIHAEQLTKASTPAEIEADNTESNIQQLAEKSNIDNDVVTEAMAEVLLQQGRTKKAIELLEKLSLLNPAKSAFFAAKINQIKEP